MLGAMYVMTPSKVVVAPRTPPSGIDQVFSIAEMTKDGQDSCQ